MRMFTRRLKDDERGMSLVFVGLGFMAFIFCAALAIDVGMFMTARSQAQNSADAGALAGATALVLDSFTDRSAGGPAVQNALEASRANTVIHKSVDVQPPDVTFPYNPVTAQNDLVQVNVFRTSARGNPVDTMLGRLMMVNTVDIRATATAQAAPANGIQCVKPFFIPDKWDENTNPPFDTLTSTFVEYTARGTLLPDADVYTDVWHDGYTGYTPFADIGSYLMIRAGHGSNIEPSMYFSWKMPGEGTNGLIGEDWFEWNICNCNPNTVTVGMDIVLEPGLMDGAIRKGIDCLMAKDPSAYWDDGTKTVHTTYSGPEGRSPRIFPLPLYDPKFYDDGKKNGRTADFRVANWLGFFLEGRNGTDVYGRIVGILGIYDPNGGPAPTGGFAKAIRLVQ